MKQMLVVLNPTAGTKRAGPVLASMLDIFCKAGFAPLVRTTQKQGDGTAIVREYAGQVERVVCIGGDGTFNETVSGLLKSGVRTPLAYIPAGSTNDLATSQGLSKNLLQAAQDAVLGTIRPIDAGRFGDRYFTYVASFGAFTKTSYTTPQDVKNVLGHLAYVLEGAASIPSIHSLHAAIDLEGGEQLEGDYLFGAVGNSTSVGGVLSLDKKLVDLQDGLFELLLVKNPRDAAELGECIRALLAQDYRSRMIELRQVRALTVRLEGESDWTLDGEFAQGGAEVRIEALPQAIRMIVPAEEA